MSLIDVRKSLNEENALLDELIATVGRFPKSKMTTSQAKFIHTSWRLFLIERKKTNNAQLKLSAGKLKQDFLLEITQLGAFIHCIPRACGYSEKWRKFLECERDISANLWKKL